MCPEGLLLVLTVHLLVLLQLPFLITRAWCKYMEAVQSGLLQPRLRLLPQSLLTQNIDSIRSGNNKLRGRMKRYHHLIEHNKWVCLGDTKRFRAGWPEWRISLKESVGVGLTRSYQYYPASSWFLCVFLAFYCYLSELRREYLLCNCEWCT